MWKSRNVFDCTEAMSLYLQPCIVSWKDWIWIHAQTTNKSVNKRTAILKLWISLYSNLAYHVLSSGLNSMQVTIFIFGWRLPASVYKRINLNARFNIFPWPSQNSSWLCFAKYSKLCTGCFFFFGFSQGAVNQLF